MNDVAARHGDTLSRIVRFALEIYVNMNLLPRETEPKAEDLERARERMRTLGKGLGTGSPPHDGSENHDGYALTKEIALSEQFAAIEESAGA